MTALVFPWRAAASARPEARSAPPPKRRAPPVLIGDAVTPAGGETLLLTLLRAQARAKADEDQRS